MRCLRSKAFLSTSRTRARTKAPPEAVLDAGAAVRQCLPVDARTLFTCPGCAIAP